jgi:hypothetical protein
VLVADKYHQSSSGCFLERYSAASTPCLASVAVGLVLDARAVIYGQKLTHQNAIIDLSLVSQPCSLIVKVRFQLLFSKVTCWKGKEYQKRVDKHYRLPTRYHEVSTSLQQPIDACRVQVGHIDPIFHRFCKGNSVKGPFIQSGENISTDTDP